MSKNMHYYAIDMVLFFLTTLTKRGDTYCMTSRSSGEASSVVV